MSVFSKIRILKNLIVLSIILLSCDDSKKNRNIDDNTNTDSLVVDNNATQNMILDMTCNHVHLSIFCLLK